MGTTISICANIALDIKNLIHSYREKHSMAYFNQGNDGNYKAYYKPKAPPGGQSSIFLGGDDKPAEQPKLKQEETKVETKVEAKSVVETQPETEPQGPPQAQ